MERLGIAIRDRAGAYTAAAVISRRPDLSLALIYDPAGMEDAFYEKNRARFSSMGITRFLLLREKPLSEGDFYEWLEKSPGCDVSIGCADSNFDTALLFRTVGDGLFHHSYVLDMIDAYARRLPKGTQSAILALCGYSYRRDDFIRALKPMGIAVLDPLDRWLESIPKDEGKGDVRFYWTVRDFPFERLMGELIGEDVRFRKYYGHPWLRGEVSKREG
ncbi:MAG: hypothetical protein SOW18_02710 [Peptoniphilus sp.]|nr:hypothetical protein [Peptoniphilus sp.]MDY3118433.1 hypothetical protein [Peptoniphilus sp.]